MLTIKFLYRDSSAKDHRPGRLFVRLIYQSKVVTMTLPVRLFENEWDSSKQHILWDGKDMERREELLTIQKQVEQEKEKILHLAAQLEIEDRLTLENLSSFYRQGSVEYSWKDLLQVLSDELLSLGQVRTSEAYHSSVRRLLSFTAKPDMALRAVDSLLIRRFEKQLKEEGKSLNTISFYMRNLRAMLGKAVKKGWIPSPKENLFQEVFTGVETTRKRALSKEELIRLSHLFEDPRSSLVKPERDALGLFLFSFHARGMSFVDLAHLRKENIKEGRICYIRRKTGKAMQIDLNRELRKLISYFSKETEKSSYLLPVIKDPQKGELKEYRRAIRMQNHRLKRFLTSGQKIRSLSTHMARHSWATIAKGENISTRVISECLGHASEKTTQIYLASFDYSVLDKASQKVARALRKAI